MEANNNDEINNDIADIQRSTSELSVFLTPAMAGIDMLSRQTTDKEDIVSGRDELVDIILSEKNFDPNNEVNQETVPEENFPNSNDSANGMEPRKFEDTPKHEDPDKPSEHEDVHGDGSDSAENEKEEAHEEKISGWVTLNHAGHAHDADHEGTHEHEAEGLYYSAPLSKQMILWHDHPLAHFVERARRVLRIHPQIIIVGRAQTIARACTLVDTLTQQKIGVIEKVSTDNHSDVYFDKVGDAQWTSTTPIIIFRVNRGELAESLSAYEQLKMSEIFEKFDSEMTGYVSFEVLESMKIAEHFHATEEHIALAKAFLAEQKEEKLDLPGFLHYAQKLISPMLKERMFKKLLNEHFDMKIGQKKRASRRSRQYSQLP